MFLWKEKGFWGYIQFSSSSSSVTHLIKFPKPQFLHLLFERKSCSHHRVMSIRDTICIVSNQKLSQCRCPIKGNYHIIFEAVLGEVGTHIKQGNGMRFWKALHLGKCSHSFWASVFQTSI